MLPNLTVPSPELLADLKLFERDPKTKGPALVSYPDPLSKGPPWTNGWGHTGPDVHPMSPITVEQAEANLLADATNALKALNRNIPWFRLIDSQARVDGLGNLCFNLGIGKLLGFHDFLGLCAEGEWQAASLDLAGTAWYKQVNGDGRGEFVCHLIGTGVRP